ncbi:hypothetical protein [Candidatus Vidania fulgoroideorum]
MSNLIEIINNIKKDNKSDETITIIYNVISNENHSINNFIITPYGVIRKKKIISFVFNHSNYVISSKFCKTFYSRDILNKKKNIEKKKFHFIVSDINSFSNVKKELNFFLKRKKILYNYSFGNVTDNLKDFFLNFFSGKHLNIHLNKNILNVIVGKVSWDNASLINNFNFINNYIVNKIKYSFSNYNINIYLKSTQSKAFLLDEKFK